MRVVLLALFIAGLTGCSGKPQEASPETTEPETEFEKTVRLAEQVDPAAQNDLGFMYDNGQSVPKDDAEAVKWNRKAAEQGDADAQCEVGEATETA